MIFYTDRFIPAEHQACTRGPFIFIRPDSDINADAAGDYLSGGDPLPGFHVNAIPAVPDWEQYRVEPNTKRRVFAGLDEDTVCYVFPDEQTFRTEAITLGLLQEAADEAL